jgi:CRP-like cAMP-binding protein
MQRQSQASFTRNHLLSVLPADDFESLRPHLERVQLNLRYVLEEPGQPIEHVYFPEPGVASVIAILPSGERMEVGLFGPEGMSGHPIILGADHSPLQSFIQVAGSGIRIKADRLRAVMESSGTLHKLLLRYVHVFSVQVAHTALSNGRQTIDERLARWLLMCHDRVDGDVIPITHEFLALMLGVRRAGVTTAIHILEGAKIIRTDRGRIEILDRAELREGAGECYGVPEAEYERLINGR